MEIDKIKVIAFDADDTLWVNETYFRKAEHEFTQIIKPYCSNTNIDKALFEKEISNLSIYGYGVKGFVLSMIELAIELSDNNLPNTAIHKIVNIGKTMINAPVELLPNVETVLDELSKTYKLIVATKGDLLDQERKLAKSGLLKYFDHVEVLSDKKEVNYKQLLKKINTKPYELLMVGNSLKSDVLPLVAIGASAIHIPFHTTWAHEEVKEINDKALTYTTLTSINDLKSILIN